MERARRLFAEGRANEATPLLVDVVRSEEGAPAGAYLMLGVSQRSEGQRDEAIVTLEKGIDRYPLNTDLKTELGVTLSWNQQFEAALAAFGATLAIDSEHRGARLARARVLVWAGKEREAEKEYSRFLSLHPDNLEAMRGMALVRRAQLRSDEAATYYKRVLAESPSDREALEGLEAIARETRWTCEAGFGGVSFDESPPFYLGRLIVSFQSSPRLALRAGYDTMLAGGIGQDVPAAGTTVQGVAHLGSVYRYDASWTLGATFSSRFQPDRTVHGLELRASRVLDSRWVALAGVRPGSDLGARHELSADVGLQRIMGSSAWVMAQGFVFRDTAGQRAESAVATVSWTPLNGWTGRAGGGGGRVNGATSSSVFASLDWAWSHRQALRVNYERGFLPFSRQSVRMDWVWKR